MVSSTHPPLRSTQIENFKQQSFELSVRASFAILQNGQIFSLHFLLLSIILTFCSLILSLLIQGQR